MEEISRKNLYDLIWSEPATKVAERFNRSDVSISKICKKYNIPKPPRGYWAKLNSGGIVKQIPLPKSSENPIIVFTNNISFVPKLDSEKVFNIKKLHDSIDKYLNLDNAHKIVQHFQKLISSSTINVKGVFDLESFQVSPENAVRALNILNAILNILEKEAIVEFDGKININFNNKKIVVIILEEIDKRKIEILPKSLRGEYAFYFDRYEWEYYPSGRLKIEIVKPCLFGNRKLWRDTEVKRLEMQIAGFIKSIISYSRK